MHKYVSVCVCLHVCTCMCLCLYDKCYFSPIGEQLAYGFGIISNLLEMVTTCDSATEHTPFIKDQVNELPKVNLEDNHIRYHL